MPNAATGEESGEGAIKRSRSASQIAVKLVVFNFVFLLLWTLLASILNRMHVPEFGISLLCQSAQRP